MHRSDCGAERAAHSNRGLKGLLAAPWLYRLFQLGLGRTGIGRWFVENHVRPFAGCRILDVGCGPGDLAGRLPDTIGAYLGVDINPAYIAVARERRKHLPQFAFVCAGVTSMQVRQNHYDIVAAVALVHHLDDVEARQLFAAAHAALTPGGRLITWDGACIENQHPLARWLLSRDRGRAVRTPAGYRALAAGQFDDITLEILHDTLRIPYTICVMTCTKGAVDAGSPPPAAR